jgi:hypothetical protein
VRENAVLPDARLSVVLSIFATLLIFSGVIPLTSIKSTPFRFALLRLAKLRSAQFRCAPLRSARNTFAPVRYTSCRSVELQRATTKGGECGLRRSFAAGFSRACSGVVVERALLGRGGGPCRRWRCAGCRGPSPPGVRRSPGRRRRAGSGWSGTPTAGRFCRRRGPVSSRRG